MVNLILIHVHQRDKSLNQRGNGNKNHSNVLFRDNYGVKEYDRRGNVATNWKWLNQF
jgi:hypothetical protein